MWGEELGPWARSRAGNYRMGIILRGEKIGMRGFRVERIPRERESRVGGEGRRLGGMRRGKIIPERGKNPTLEIPPGIIPT